eukprot:UN01809
MTRWYHIMSLPISFYKVHPKYIAPILEKILTDLKVNVTLNKEAKDYDSIQLNYVNAKRRACYTLLALARKIGDIVIQHWNSIWKLYQEITSGDVHEAVQGTLLEFLVATSNAVTDENKRFGFLCNALQRPLKTWDNR